MRLSPRTLAVTDSDRLNLPQLLRGCHPLTRRVRATLAMCCALISSTHANEPGLLLREGIWNGDVGSYTTPLR